VDVDDGHVPKCGSLYLHLHKSTFGWRCQYQLQFKGFIHLWVCKVSLNAGMVRDEQYLGWITRWNVRCRLPMW
jgi:hypothetical protein